MIGARRGFKVEYVMARVEEQRTSHKFRLVPNENPVPRRLWVVYPHSLLRHGPEPEKEVGDDMDSCVC